MVRPQALTPFLALWMVSMVACGDEPTDQASGATGAAAEDPDRVTIASQEFDPATDTVKVKLQGPANQAVLVMKSDSIDADETLVQFGADGSSAELVVDLNWGSTLLVFRGDLTALEDVRVKRDRKDPRLQKLEVPTPPRMKATGTFGDQFECTGGTACSVVMKPLDREWEVSGPAGATLAIGEQTISLDGTKKRVAIDYMQLSSGVDLSTYMGERKEPPQALLPIVLTSGGDTLAYAQMRLYSTQLDNVLNQAFRGVRTGPIAGDITGTATIWLDTPDGPVDPIVRFVGEAKSISDIKYVAVSKRTASKTRQCGAYGAGGAQVQVTATGYGQDIVLYDRATGAKLGEKSFMAPAKCPSSLYADTSGGSASSGAFVDESSIGAWVAKTVGN